MMTRVEVRGYFMNEIRDYYTAKRLNKGHLRDIESVPFSEVSANSIQKMLSAQKM